MGVVTVLFLTSFPLQHNLLRCSKGSGLLSTGLPSFHLSIGVSFFFSSSSQSTLYIVLPASIDSRCGGESHWTEVWRISKAHIVWPLLLKNTLWQFSVGIYCTNIPCFSEPNVSYSNCLSCHLNGQLIYISIDKINWLIIIYIIIYNHLIKLLKTH